VTTRSEMTARPLPSRTAETTDLWLRRCVGDPEDFLAKSWGQAPSVHRGKPDQFRDIFSHAQLVQLLEMGVIPSVKIRMVRNGRILPDRTWATEEKRLLAANSRRIAELVSEGHTLAIRQVEWYAPGLFELCQGLQAELTYLVGTNVYLTPPSSQGFRSHYDDHDVIVLQLEGEKDWQVFDRTTDEPLRGPTNVQVSDGQAPVLAARLAPGDSLYVPRGFVHCATAAGLSSLHISVGIYAATAADLLRYALNTLALSPALGVALAPAFAEHPDEVEALLAAAGRSLKQQLADPAMLAELAAGFCQAWSAGHAASAPASSQPT
jgi:bifunctional lysine-specific demethylase and histidyl-hydroxylase NO66